MSRPPCICHPLHGSCDPKYLDEAASTGLDRGLSYQTHVKRVKHSFSREDLARAIEEGCPTCEILHMGIASHLAHNTSKDLIQVRRSSNYLTVEHFGWSAEYFREAQSGMLSENG